MKTLLCLFFLIAAPIFAKITVGYHKLDNGLQVLLYPQKQAPVVVCRLFYATGSVHETTGNTGVAHMLEHMLFKGTLKVGVTDAAADAGYLALIDQVIDSLDLFRKMSDSSSIERLKAKYDSLLRAERGLFVKDELWETYLKEGGSDLNAFTSDLMTAYFVTLPKNKLELFLWLEADRMQNAVMREFYPERDVVLEERKMRVDDSPYGRYWESLTGIFYEAHPFRVPTIGYESDISNYTREQVQEHYRKYYKPNNAILVLAGDFESDSALSLIRKYFLPIPQGETLKDIVTREPEPAGEKRLTVRKADARPRLDMLFLTPEIGHPDIYALDVLEGVLSGNSGRLHRKLVQDLKMAVSASAGNSVDKYHSAFQITVSPGPNPDIRGIETVIWEILEELKNAPISERELQRVKNRVAAQSLRKLQSLDHLATELAYCQLWGTWEHINTFPEAVALVTADDVLRVCRKYLLPDRATVGSVISSAAQETEK